jgi:hypothetical protein
MSYSGETNEESCLSPLDSARFIMERARHVSINLPSLQKLSTTVCFSFYYLILNKKNFCLDIICNDGWRMFN